MKSFSKQPWNLHEKWPLKEIFVFMGIECEMIVYQAVYLDITAVRCLWTYCSSNTRLLSFLAAYNIVAIYYVLEIIMPRKLWDKILFWKYLLLVGGNLLLYLWSPAFMISEFWKFFCEICCCTTVSCYAYMFNAWEMYHITVLYLIYDFYSRTLIWSK